MIDLVNQRRRPNPTLAPREVKLRFWSLLAGCRFLLHNVVRCFCKVHRDMNHVNVFAIHRCINEGYGLIQIFTEKYGFPPRNCGVSAILQIQRFPIMPDIPYSPCFPYFMASSKWDARNHISLLVHNGNVLL